MDEHFIERYFLSVDGHPETETEVSKEEWVKAERRAGFNNTMGHPEEPGTGGFSGGGIRGRIETTRK